MCGIAGIISIRDDRESASIELLSSMVAALRHRGPDEYGLYRDHRAGLVHARLSILDLLTGQQPLSNEDESLWITFNGEIFNYIELRRELESLGHLFRTQSDTEVIVHAYESWGRDCFSRLNGQWAIALWDSNDKNLVLSRDRFGICPLYVQEDAKHIRFASEVKAIFADSNVHRALNPRGILQTFTYWTTIAPVTPFEGIEELPPASIWMYDEHGHKKEFVYWTPSYPLADGEETHEFQYSLRMATEILEEKLRRATRLRMTRSDVPVGSYLSGGLDSSLIAQMGWEAKGEGFQTFSMRFEDAEFDETGSQRMMASGIGGTHHEVIIRKEDIAGVFPEVVLHAEHPVLRTAPAPLFLLSRAVRETGIKAVLTGEGADEMLAGYDLFREAKIREFWAREPGSRVRPRLLERLYPYLARSPQMAKGMALRFWSRGLERVGQPGFSHEPRWLTTSAIQRFLSADWSENDHGDIHRDVLGCLPTGFRKWSALAQAQYLEIATLLSGYLLSSQGDRMLMAHSVEGRFPYLDPEVVEFCDSVPDHYKLSLLNEKYILKKVADGKIPNAIIHRHKQPYRAPDITSLLTGKRIEYVEDLFSEETVRHFGIFESSAVHSFYEKCVRQQEQSSFQSQFSNSDNMAFVGILSTQLLYKLFVDSLISKPADEVIFKTHVDHTLVHSY